MSCWVLMPDRDSGCASGGCRPWRPVPRGDASQAIERGASHIVVGRPITGADDPLAAFDAIVAELVENVA